MTTEILLSAQIDENAKLEKFKKWAIMSVRHYSSPYMWAKSDMKAKLDELGLSDDYE